MRKEDNSPQGKIVTELLQHLHACKVSRPKSVITFGQNNCDVFYGREDELEKLEAYIKGPSQKVPLQSFTCVVLSRLFSMAMRGQGSQLYSAKQHYSP